MDETAEPVGRDDAILDRIVAIMWLGIGAALIALVMAHASDLIAAVGICVIVFLTAFAGGSVLGFLFGVPRAVAEQNASTGPAAASPPAAPPPSVGAPPPSGVPPAHSPPAAPTANRSRLLQSNTNLERISDWLTTLLVGAGLVQLSKINDLLLGFHDFLASSARVFGPAGKPTAGAIPTVGVLILVFGLACGFLYMYLNTRLVLIRLFFTVERVLAGDEKLGGQARRGVQEVLRQGDGVSHFLQDQLARRRSMTIDDALQLMLNLLYKNTPDSVVALGRQLSTTDAVNRAEYWYYLAAAFGQQLDTLKDADRRADAWTSARDSALDCAQRAVALNPGYRSLLWSLSDPNSTDNDLAMLRDDPTFRRIVGQGTS